MKGWIKEYFTFNRGERRGIFVLLTLIIVVITILSFGLHLKEEELFDMSIYEKEIDDLLANQEKDRIAYCKPNYNTSLDTSKFVSFDPNTVNLELLKNFGFSDKLLKTINNYRGKGGCFKKKQDFKKIYGVNDALYVRVEKYIVINNKYSNTNDYSKFKKYSKPKEYKEYSKTNYDVTIEINSADTTQLKKIRGIGSFFAKEIVKQREKLGGFHSKEQLLEVYNIDEEKLKSIETYLKVDTLLIKGLNVNMLTAKELANHPYLNYFQAKSIISYRKMIGKIKNIDELLQNKVLPKDDFNKIRHYLTE